ncbi:DegT/DnrJ/EryC1/StrS family aminotransferase [Microcoleus sp.]|uniref:DegT/DnrJ/EryC1/StrS family aminotransferase n=1 Tax=Microcoleus sp. TaxID=44472 RepID=UPI00352690C1
MIDPLFPPQPKHKIITLYPFKTKLDIPLLIKSIFSNQNYQKLFIDIIWEYLPTLKGELFFMNKGRFCLHHYLIWKKQSLNRTIKIALPAFGCHHLCSEIVMAGAQPVFLDIDESYGISIKSVNFAKKQNVDIILWPNLFGPRERAKEVISHIEELAIEIIFDEAQSFPSGVLSDKYISLLSFGNSKRLQGIGGGAIYFPEYRIEPEFEKYIKNLKLKMSANYKINQIKETVKNNLLAGELSKLFPTIPSLEKKLPTLLEKQTKNLKLSDIYGMNELMYIVCYERVKMLKTNRECLSFFYKNLQRSVVSKFGENSINILKQITDIPTIFALSLPFDQRYNISQELANIGIQTTWYYYPLNKIKAFSKYPSENITNTEKLSSEILIIPFGLGNIIYQKKAYEMILRQKFL